MSDEGPFQASLSREDFVLFRELISQYCGIHLPDTVDFVLERRLRPRLRILELDSFREYYRHVKYGRDSDKEISEIIERITTNETYFFRELYQLQDCIEEMIPDVAVHKGADATIRIWSAGCSSGEEPLSLCMLLRESGLDSKYNFRIVGTDISWRVLEKAQRGLYRETSFREMSDDMRSTYFEPEGSRFRVRDDIRSHVEFRRMNLMNPGEFLEFSDIHIVLCRNVMIYFSKYSRGRLLDLFFQRMSPGGYLLLGHSESLIGGSSGFEMVPLKRGLVYRKPLDAETGNGGPPLSGGAGA